VAFRVQAITAMKRGPHVFNFHEFGVLEVAKYALAGQAGNRWERLTMGVVLSLPTASSIELSVRGLDVVLEAER
jgi:hypothetical protein